MDVGNIEEQLREENARLREALAWALPIAEAGIDHARDRLRDMVRECKGGDVEMKLKDIDAYWDLFFQEEARYRKALAALATK